MPKDLIQEFIGKICHITLFNDSFGMTVKIIEVEENWIKVEPYKSKEGIKLINGDMIRDIAIMPEKYQK